ncbi:MAG TPA: DUF222 domain-containing protein [Streptosporangiaceae bacterium]
MRSTDLGAATSGELAAGITAFAAELAARPAPGSGAVCYEEVAALGRAVDLLESAIAARVGVAASSGYVAEWGHASPTAWLRGSLGMRHVRAQERAVLADQLPRLPRVAERLAAGELSSGYAAAIATGVRRLDEADCGKAERLLLGFVDDCHSVGQITRFADRIKDLIADRDGSAAEPEDGRHGERQWLALRRSGSGAFVKGRFGPELIALIKAKVEPLATPCGPEDTRDHSERLADALQTHLSGGDSRWDPILVIELHSAGATRSMTDSAPASGPAAAAPPPERNRPSTTPTARRSREGSGPGGVVPAPPGPGWPFDGTPFTARLADGTPVPTQRARQILLNAGFSALVLGADGLPLYLGRRVRCGTPAQRRVLLTRYPTCVVDDCEIPGTGCQIEHVQGWENGQGSDIDQLVLCCSFHNRYKWRYPDRVIIDRRADGRYSYYIRRPTNNRSRKPRGHSARQRSPGHDP